MTPRLESGSDALQAAAAFTELDASLYQGHPLKAAPKDFAGGPHFVRWFLVSRGSAPAARAALYHNPGLQGAPNAFLVGSFEADGADTARLLLDGVAAEAARRGGRSLIGPMNGSTWDDYRFSLDAERPPFFTEPVHRPEYPAFFLESGFVPLTNYVSQLDSELLVDEPYMEGLARRFEKRGTRIRSLDLGRYRDELVRVHQFCLESFRNAVLFSPIAEEDFLAKYLPLAPLLKPEFVLLAEEGDRLVGLVLCLDDRYDRGAKGLIFKTIARDPALAYSGIVHLMANSVHREARRQGYAHSIHAFMHADNVSRTVSSRFVGQPFRRYQLYSRGLV